MHSTAHSTAKIRPGYHLTNAALHTLNALLLLALLLRRRTDVRVALLLSAAVGALHPRLTEAAGWVSGRTDVLATTFCFLGLAGASQPFARANVRQRRAAVFSAALEKRSRWLGLAASTPEELRRRAPGSRERGQWKRGLVFTLPLLGAFVAYGGLRLSALAGTKPVLAPLSLGERVGAAVEALGRYAFDLAVPWLPRAQQGQLGVPDHRFTVVALVVFVATGTIAWRRRDRSLRVGACRRRIGFAKSR